MNPLAFLSLTTEGLFVVMGVMLPLVLWLLDAWRRSSVRLNVERQALVGLNAAIGQFRQASQEAGGQEGGEILAAVGSSWKSTLVYRVAESLDGLKDLAAPDVNAVMELLVAREATPLSRVRTIPNLLMLAGLLGTVWGLAQTVGSLGPAVQGSLNASSPEQLARALGDTLASMKGAFGCSLAGIFLSGASSLALGQATRQSECFADDLRDVMLTGFVPSVYPVSSESQLADQAKLMRESRRFVKDLQVTMKATDGIVSRMGAEMNSAAEKIHRVSEDLGDKLGRGADALAQAQVKFASSFEENTTRLTERLDVQLQKLVEVQGALSGVSGGLDRTAQKFDEGGNRQLQAARDVQAKVHDAFEQLSLTLAKERDEHTGVFSEVRSALQVLTEQQKGLPTEFHAAFSRANAEQDRLVTAVQVLLGTTNATQSGVNTELDRVSAVLERVANQSALLEQQRVEQEARSRGELANLLAAARAPLERAAEGLQTGLQELQAERQSTLDANRAAQASLVDAGRETTRLIAERLEAMAGRDEATHAADGATLHAWLDALATLVERMPAQIAATGGVASRSLAGGATPNEAAALNPGEGAQVSPGHAVTSLTASVPLNAWPPNPGSAGQAEQAAVPPAVQLEGWPELDWGNVDFDEPVNPVGETGETTPVLAPALIGSPAPVAPVTLGRFGERPVPAAAAPIVTGSFPDASGKATE